MRSNGLPGAISGMLAARVYWNYIKHKDRNDRISAMIFKILSAHATNCHLYLSYSQIYGIFCLKIMHPKPAIPSPKPRNRTTDVWPEKTNRKNFSHLVINPVSQILTRKSLEKLCCVESHNSYRRPPTMLECGWRWCTKYFSNDWILFSSNRKVCCRRELHLNTKPSNMNPLREMRQSGSPSGFQDFRSSWKK